MSRLHPFDVAFASVAEEWFGAIDRAVSGDEIDLGRFATLDAVERILSQLQPGEPAPETVQARDEYLRLLYAGYEFWIHGGHTVALARDRMEQRLADSATTAMPDVAIASYSQFPPHWFWMQVDPESPHEPLDGLFIVTASGARREWLIVAVLGLRAERGGFSQVSATVTAADLATASRALPDRMFAPAMAGGDVAGFRSITSAAELLTAARLALASAGP